MGGGFLHENNDASGVDDLGGGFVPELADSAPAVEVDGEFIPENDTALESGGGFVPEVDEDMFAGRFLPESDVPDVQPVSQTTSKDVHMDTEQEVGSIMPDKQEEDTFDPDEAEDTFDPDDMDTETKALPREDSTGAHKQEEEEEDDHGSLLSHDPEDDDAEPDWLYSD
jgi:xeroderma pigmentosum group C-complementing protein